jgi:hypothetical protein
MVTAAFFGELPLDAQEAKAIDELKAAMMAIDPGLRHARGEKVDAGVWQRLEEIRAAWRQKHPHLAQKFTAECERLAGEEGTAPPNPSASGRDQATGKFTKGNRYGSAGSPFAKRLMANRSAILRAVSTTEITGLARRLLKQAMGGDLAAAVVLLSYTVGKPRPVFDPDDF